MVGYSQVAGVSGTHAFRYAQGRMIDLGSLQGSSGASVANDVNDAGLVVGSSSASCGDGRPSNVAAYLHNGSAMQDLNALIDPASGWHLEDAVAINESGQIVAHGLKREGTTWKRGAVMLTPR